MRLVTIARSTTHRELPLVCIGGTLCVEFPRPVPTWGHVPEYERHELEKALPHQIVRKELGALRARGRESGSPVARFVEREIRAHLDCDVVASFALTAMTATTIASWPSRVIWS